MSKADEQLPATLVSEGVPAGRVRFGMSSRLLVLTVAFVMLAEVFIFAPSAGRFRFEWFQERLEAAHLAALALEATPSQAVEAPLEKQLLEHAGILSATVIQPDHKPLALMPAAAGKVDHSIDLRQAGPMELILGALELIARDTDRRLSVVGRSPSEPETTVEIVVEEDELRDELISFSIRIVLLSLAISLMTAAAVFFSLQFLFVRPMRRLIESMGAFRDRPEDASRVIVPSQRKDEIGVAERELALLQTRLREELHNKGHLAALGISLSKINHDLRNMLSSVRLISDSLGASDDPKVRRATPALQTAIDRAIDLCQRTLDFAGEGPPPVRLEAVALAALVAEAGAAACASVERDCEWSVEIEPELLVRADPDHLFRVVTNLGRNAFQAGAQRIAISASRIPEGPGGNARSLAVVTVADDGPGLPRRMREKLFEPFISSRSGGSGLGLSIARDLMAAQGGSIQLAATGKSGTRFKLTLPVAG